MRMYQVKKKATHSGGRHCDIKMIGEDFDKKSGEIENSDQNTNHGIGILTILSVGFVLNRNKSPTLGKNGQGQGQGVNIIAVINCCLL